MPYHSIKDPGRLHALLDAILLVGSGLDLEGVLRKIVEAGCRLTDARYGALGVLNAQRTALADFIHSGMPPDVADRIGHLPEGMGILGLLIREQHPIRLRDLDSHPQAFGFPPDHPPMKSFLGVPVRVGSEVFGNLYLTEKQGADEFSETDEALALALSGAAAMAIQNGRLHATLEELALSADRERIARELHDTVIQRLFSTGLSLQSLLHVPDESQVQSRIEEAVTELDETIRQIRTTIFALEPPPPARKGVRAQILAVCTESERTLGFDPEVRFSGPIDNAIDGVLAGELVAVLREALSNVARHGRAKRVQVIVSAHEGLELRVADDGVGFESRPGGTGHGLANMARRAELRGGTFDVSRGDEGGTNVTWRVPPDHLVTAT